MAIKPSISFVGAGNLARALAPALCKAGYPIGEIVSRDHRESLRRAQTLARTLGADAVTLTDCRLDATLVWFCVNDAAIRECATNLASRAYWEGKFAVHSSGALTSEELAPLRLKGAEIASLHPLMTFVRRSTPSFAGVSFAVEGDRATVAMCKRVVRDLGGAILDISGHGKALYHAWGAFGSPLLVMELALAERVAEAAGISRAVARKTVEKIVRRTIDNYFAFGASAAFSGPLVRGDVETVRRHLQELSQVPGAREVYLALARSALRTLPVGHNRQMQELLDDCE